MKGVWVGLVVALLIPSIYTGFMGFFNPFQFIGFLCIIVPECSFVVMNLTGSSTYTSLSGVYKEMRIAIPLQIIGLIVGTLLWLISLFIISNLV